MKDKIVFENLRTPEGKVLEIDISEMSEIERAKMLENMECVSFTARSFGERFRADYEFTNADATQGMQRGVREV